MDSANNSQEKYNELLQTHDQVYKHMYCLVKPMVLICAVRLGLFDAIHSHAKSMTLDELVPVLSINPEKAQFMPRLVRILTHFGYFSEKSRGDKTKEYALTTLSKLLLKDQPFTLRNYVLAMADPILMNPWGLISDWLRNDQPQAFNMAHGVSLWDYTSHDKELNANFNRMMENDSRLLGSILAKNGKSEGLFDGVRSLVDVAGGTGEMAKAIANAYPHIACTVLDLPHVVEGLQGKSNLAYVAGDMFEAIPPANIVLLKWILHDWNDESCVKILKQCKKAIMGGIGEGPRKVMIIDMVVDNEDDKDAESRQTKLAFDIKMMILFRGKERTESEWMKLFKLAGFPGGYKIHSMLGLRSLIEVYP